MNLSGKPFHVLHYSTNSFTRSKQLCILSSLRKLPQQQVNPLVGWWTGEVGLLQEGTFDFVQAFSAEISQLEHWTSEIDTLSHESSIRTWPCVVESSRHEWTWWCVLLSAGFTRNTCSNWVIAPCYRISHTIRIRNNWETERFKQLFAS